MKRLEPSQTFHIEITYLNNEKKLYDMKKFLEYNCYKNLKNVAYFKQVKSAETTVEWPDGEDVDPNELYDNSIAIN